jgi:hypothetical protein
MKRLTEDQPQAADWLALLSLALFLGALLLVVP